MISPSRDLIFAEYANTEDAVRAKDTIERDMEELFDWSAADEWSNLPINRDRPNPRMPPKPGRRLQVAFVAELPPREPENTATVALHFCGLPPNAESALELAAVLPQYRVGECNPLV